MTKDEVKWLRQVKKWSNRFNICIEDDEIWVNDIKDYERKFNFEHSGKEFIFELLNQLGYKSEII